MIERWDSARWISDPAALLLTCVAVAAILLSSRHLLDDTQSARQARSDPGIQVSLQAPEPAPTPTLPPHLPPLKAHRARTSPPPVPTPAPTAPVPMGDPPAAADAAFVPSPAAAAQPESHPDLDAQYAAELRADIDSRTHPPESALYRLRHPSGEVRVSFVVTRGGEVKAVALLHSSGSAMLDETALEIVSSGHYPPMPAKAFGGETKHAFAVTIEFRRDRTSA